MPKSSNEFPFVKWLGVIWVPILSYTRKRGRLWGAVTLDQLLKRLEKEHGIYEILIPDVPRKIHFDIDKSNASFDEIKSIITGYFPGAIMNISGRLDGPEGMSVHITLENYFAPNLECMEVVKVIALQKLEKGFDPRIYTKNRNMKCINQAKPNEEVQKYLEGNTNIVNHLILHGINKDKCTNVTKRELLIDILAIPQQNLPVPEDFDWMTAMPLDKLAKLPNPAKYSPGWLDHSTIWQVMRWCKHVGITFEQFWIWNRSKTNFVERYKHYLRYWQDCNYPVSEEAIALMLERIYPNIREPQATKRLREQFDVPVHKTVEGQFLSADDISTKIKYTVLKSPMGTNKTGSVVSFLTKHAKESSVLWITPRSTLSQNTLQRLKDEGMPFVNYKPFSRPQKLAGILNKQNYLICSIQSLHYLDKNFDYIVADEWDTIAGTLAKDFQTHKKNLTTNGTIWVNQLQKAKKVIIMDALTTKLTTNFLDGICKKGVEYITKAIMEHFRWEEDREVLSYYGAKDEEKKKLAQVEEVWTKDSVRCIVTNGTISVGVNFNKPDVFDHIHAFYTPQIPVRDFFQALYRTFDLFAEKANVLIHPEKMEIIAKKNAKYIRDLLDRVKVRFDWERIPDVPEDDDVIFDLMATIHSHRATVDDRLMFQKFQFKCNFVDDTDEAMLKDMWKKNIDLPTKVAHLRGNPDNLINKVLAENNTRLGEIFPNNMVTSLPFDEIQRYFKFHNPPRDYRTHLVSRMLNAYFGNKVYSLKCRKRNWSYETCGKFLEHVQVCQEKMRKFNRFKLRYDDDDEEELSN
ncbi:hypothetical protein HK104_010655 [Borealophlyctis nickersoniae]|nr:hypothetical protein HK104_010655 [Borealophlyctis nickersoniae]